jgi:hypothetical protein
MLPERQVTDSLLIAPQAMTNSATVTANIDTIGSSYATIRVALASEINTNAVGPTLSLLQSDDTVRLKLCNRCCKSHGGRYHDSQGRSPTGSTFAVRNDICV